MDLDIQIWTIPALRMNMKHDHRVPMSGRSMEIVEAARGLDDVGNPPVFPSERGKRLDERWLLRLLQKHRIAAVPQGIRSSFWA